MLTFRLDKITTKRCEPAETHRKTQHDHKNPNETRQQTQNQKNDRQVNRRQQINCDKQKKEQSHKTRRGRERQPTAAEVHDHIVHNSHTSRPHKSSCTRTHTGSVADPTWPPPPPTPHLFVIKAGGNLLHFLFHTSAVFRRFTADLTAFCFYYLTFITSNTFMLLLFSYEIVKSFCFCSTPPTSTLSRSGVSPGRR